MSNISKYSIKYYYPSIADAINSVSRIYLHFGHYIDYKNNYFFKNSTSNNGTIESNEECIEYIQFDKRNQCVGMLHGKVNFDNSVDTFDCYPLSDYIPKVFLLPEGWQIIRKGGNNKIALRVYDNIVFWLLTCHNNFIMHKESRNMENDLPSCSIIDTSSLTMEQIDFISTIFKQVGGFRDLQFTQESVYSVDTTNNLFMFTGIMKDNQMGIFASLFDGYE